MTSPAIRGHGAGQADGHRWGFGWRALAVYWAASPTFTVCASRSRSPTAPGWDPAWARAARRRVVPAEDEEAANCAVENLTEADPAGVNLGAAITSFCRQGPESLNFHARHSTNAALE